MQPAGVRKPQRSFLGRESRTWSSTQLTAATAAFFVGAFLVMASYRSIKSLPDKDAINQLTWRLEVLSAQLTALQDRAVSPAVLGSSLQSVSVSELPHTDSTESAQCIPAKRACMFKLGSGHPDCHPNASEVEQQATYFMKNWLAEFRNSRETDVLGPEVVFSEKLTHISLITPKATCLDQVLTMQLMKEIITELQDDCWVFDVGANIGTYADWLLDNTPDHCQILSYEPVPPTWKTLQKRHEKHARVHTYNKAVSDSNGFTNIAFGKSGDRGAKLGGRSDATSSAEVQVVTLASEIAHLGSSARIPFVKVDVESLEFSVLQGLAEVLSGRRVRSILWERNPEQHQCSCGQKDPAGRCACTPHNSMRTEVDYVASFGYHVFLPGTKYFLRIDGRYWHDSYEVDIYKHTGRKSPVINLLAVAPGDPILAYIAETRTMLEVPGVFQF